MMYSIILMVTKDAVATIETNIAINKVVHAKKANSSPKNSTMCKVIPASSSKVGGCRYQFH
jgi:hypothetical protein